MTRIFLATNLLLVALVVGCSQKEAETPTDLQAVFDAKKAGAAGAGAPQEVQMMVNQAVSALEKKDEATAVMTLRDLRSNPALNDVQVRAVEDMMKKAYLDLGERAARGDQQAAAQLQMLNMNPR